MNIGKSIYLDHQATTPVDSRALAEMEPYWTALPGNPHSLDHYVGWKAMRAVEEAASRIARLIGADADEIIFTSGATESNNLALLGLARRATNGKRRRVLVSAIEHKCVLAAARVIRDQLGFIVEHIPVDGDGRIAMSVLEETLDDDVLVISIMAVNNEIGTVQNLKAISELTRRHGVIFHCDAAQAPTAIDLSSIVDCVDLLSLSSHKMYGPKGVGTLFIRRDLQDQVEPIIYGGGQQNGLRSGTIPVPLVVGMGVATEIFTNIGSQKKRVQLRVLRDKFVKNLTNLHWKAEVNGPKSQDRHPGNANIRFEGFSAHDILSALQPRLAASTGSACTSGIPEPSHVLKAIGLNGNEAEASIRFSLGFGTTDEEIEAATRLIEETLDRVANNRLAQTT